MTDDVDIGILASADKRVSVLLNVAGRYARVVQTCNYQIKLTEQLIVYVGLAVVINYISLGASGEGDTLKLGEKKSTHARRRFT